MSEALLQIRDLDVGLANGAPLLHRVSFAMHKGETFALLGESGSGKSMSALSIMRLLPEGVFFRAGSICFEGRDLLKLPAFAMRQVRGRKIAMIFQEPMTALNPVATAGDQIVESLKLHGGMSLAGARRRTLAAFDDVGLDDAALVFKSYPHELSGGMKQRVMIAMALAGSPDLLIADEPTTALDVTIQAQVLELLKSLQARLNMAMLFISHDLSIVSNIADRIAVVKEGCLVDESDVSGFFTGRRHPYSQHLLQVVPSVDKRGSFLSGRFAGKAICGGADAGRSAGSVQRLLELDGVEVHFPIRAGLFQRVQRHVKAVDGVSLALGSGRTLALVGESGSGKTTVARAILGLVSPTAGSVRFEGTDVACLRGNALRAFRHQVQIVFQDPFSSMNPKMQVGEIIKEGMRVQKTGDESSMHERMVKLLESVGMDASVARRYPHEFSGGQRQRICIARALAVEPKLLICDEPTSALDVSVQAQILDLFRCLQNDLGLSYLFISHDISVVSCMAHEIAVMYRGQIVEAGEAVSLLENPRDDYTRALLAAVPAIKRD